MGGGGESGWDKGLHRAALVNLTSITLTSSWRESERKNLLSMIRSSGRHS